MTSFISSYNTGAMNSSAEAMTEQKLNACIKSLESLVEEFKPEETNQGYFDFSINDQLYYYGFTKQLDYTPQSETPIICDIGKLSLVIGKVDVHGVFITTMLNETNEHLTDYKFISVNTESYTGPKSSSPPSPPQGSDSTQSYSISDNETINGATITDSGTRTRHTVTSYYNLVLRTSGGYYWWTGDKQTRVYDIYDYTRILDISNWHYSVNRKLLKSLNNR